MTQEPLFTRRFFAMWTFAFVTFFSAFQLLPAIPFRILELGGSKSTAGLFLSVYTFASAFAAPVMGSIADALGRKRMLVTASLLFIGFSVLYGVVTSIPLLLLVGVVHGSLWSGLMASASAIMSEFIPVSRRTQGLAYWGLASTAAIGIAPAAGLLIFRTWGWRELCGELAVLSLLMAIWSSRLPEVPSGMGEAKGSLREAWDLPVTVTALSLASIAFGYGGVTSYAALYAIEKHVHPDSLYFSVFAVMIILIRVSTSHLGDRFGAKAVLYPAFAAIPVSFLILAFANTRTTFVISAILFGAGLGSAYPAFANFVLSHTDPNRRARTFGSIVWAFDTGIGAGSLLMGMIGERSSLSRAYLVAAGVALLAIPIFAFASRMLHGRGTSVA
jgi:MFS family permease